MSFLAEYWPHLAAAGGASLLFAYLSTGTRVTPARTEKPHKDSFVTYDKKSPVWVTAPDSEAVIRRSSAGIASLAPVTVFDCFKAAVKKHADKPALRWETSPGIWTGKTYQEYYDTVMDTARALVAVGVEQFDSVNIIGFNSPEWFYANLGAIAVGAKAAGIYTTNGPDACKYICEHSGARVVVCENEDQLKKFIQIRPQLPALKAIVMWKGQVAAHYNVKGQAPVYSWDEFIAKKDSVPMAEIEKRIAAQRPGQCCTLIYTSGTTGTPKAVMMSHDNLTWVTKSLYENMKAQRFMEEQEHVISYLPLSHIAAQVVDIHMPIGATGWESTSGYATVYFARPDALKGSLGETLKAVRPTFFFGVPRVWEKMMEKMKAIGAAAPAVRKKLSAWARGVGVQGYYAQQVGGDGYLPAGYGVASKIIYSKVKAALGLERCKVASTGAAPIAKETLEFFGSLGVHVLELYGMSECAGPQTVSFPHIFKTRSTGIALPGCEMKIFHDPSRDKEGEGEICFRGRHIMMGYMNNPQKSQEAVDPDGWLHSGDVGRIDEHGLLYITGRIKELIITAGGENIAPVPIEDTLKAELPGISNAMLIGDKRKYVVVLVTLKTEPTPDGGFSDALAGDALNVSSATTVSEAKNDPKWTEYIMDGIKRANDQVVSRAARMQKFAIVPEFSVPAGDLTPTLKLKRPIVSNKHAAVIDGLYQ